MMREPEAARRGVEFTQNALVETRGRQRFVYGLWGRVFGVWRKANSEAPSLPVVPDWPLFDPAGASAADRWEVLFCTHPPFAHPLQQGPFGYRVHPPNGACPETVAAFARFASIVPADVRAAVAPLGRYQWHALLAISRIPAFLGRLDPSRPIQHRMALLLCWWLAGNDHARPTVGSEIDRLIFGRKTRRVLRSHARCSDAELFASRVLRLSREFVDVPELEEMLAELRRACARPEGRVRKTLAMLPPLRIEALRYLAQAPAAFVQPAVALALEKLPKGMAGRACRFLCDEALRVAPEKRASLAEALRHVDGSEQLAKTVIRWQALVRGGPFPYPPFPGDSRLTPIETWEKLDSEGKRLHHCAASFVDGVRSGRCYFYKWTGSEEATLQIVKDDEGRWSFGDMRGFDDLPVRIETLREALIALTGPSS